ncbi:sulfurtransferase [Thiomicrospira microaerophila]|uniref:sulfurtransferase n=1 Tax=Thiomicrospira microaerophila TaxID=406020 RepID=UPI00200F2257|nr:rhodanese-like domain-containing protein [Thiomicrospira microaerophila]UQB42121.1 sulfurtransferase [Thiomicrospira microaerophila]
MHRTHRRLQDLKSIWLVLILFSGLTSAATINPIVDRGWLAEHIHHPDLRIIDVREPHNFQAGHLANSVNLPYPLLFDQYLNLPPLSKLQTLLSEAGVDASKKVVVLDHGGFKWAARLVWVLHALGHTEAGLLNVGYGHWPEGMFEISQQAKEVEKTQFITRVDRQRMKSYLDTLVATQQTNHFILDARPSSHFLGLSSLAERAGHIPNALNFPAVNNSLSTDLGSQLLDLEELAHLYQDLPKNQDIILYCNDGASAAINYVVLHALGYRASVYEGSWLEWGNNPSLPINNPSQ